MIILPKEAWANFKAQHKNVNAGNFDVLCEWAAQTLTVLPISEEQRADMVQSFESLPSAFNDSGLTKGEMDDLFDKINHLLDALFANEDCYYIAASALMVAVNFASFLTICEELSQEEEEPSHAEKVLVVPNRLGSFLPLDVKLNRAESGCFPVNPLAMNGFYEFVDKEAWFCIRENAEEDPRLKQIIPYIFVIDPFAGKVLCYTRCKKSGEQRLAGKKSLGFGGHINPVDFAVGSMHGAIRQATYRELQEELNITGAMYATQPFGFVNNERDAVGEVHLGFVVACVLNETGLATLTTGDGVFTADWMTAQDLWDHEHDKLEAWSQMLLPRIADYLRGKH